MTEHTHLDKGGGVVERLANHVSPVVRAQVDHNPVGAASRRIITRGHLRRGVACDICSTVEGSQAVREIEEGGRCGPHFAALWMTSVARSQWPLVW